MNNSKHRRLRAAAREYFAAIDAHDEAHRTTSAPVSTAIEKTLCARADAAESTLRALVQETGQ